MRRIAFLARAAAAESMRAAGSVGKASNPASPADEDALDDLFREIESYGTSTRSGTSKGGSSSSSPSATDTLAAIGGASKDLRMKVELTKQRRLQKLLKEAKKEETIISNEKMRGRQKDEQREYAPSPPGKMYFSSAELIQEKSPQYLNVLDSSGELIKGLPCVQRSACSAVITLVARVTTATSDLHESKTDISLCGDDIGVFSDIIVEYEVPFVSSTVTSKVLIRCYGDTLSLFARDSVNKGDIVHVLGHLAPLPASSLKNSRDVSVAVCALPVGGNISVVLPASAALS